MPERPMLAAAWRHLVLLNFPVPTEVVAALAPYGTEPDFHDGQAYISIVAFRFDNIRFLGLPIPGHTNFPEINLRYYVRRTIGKEIRRGVVFAREIAPRHAVAVVANRVYHESYITRPMRSDIHVANGEPSPGDTIAYAWKTKIPLPFREGQGEGLTSQSATRYWSRVAARVAAPLALPAAGSLEEFLIEHYWAYTHGRDNRTREYYVSHPPWRTAPVEDIEWICDVPQSFPSPLAKYLTTPPTNAFVAEGSPIQLFGGQRMGRY